MELTSIHVAVVDDDLEARDEARVKVSGQILARACVSPALLMVAHRPAVARIARVERLLHLMAVHVVRRVDGIDALCWSDVGELRDGVVKLRRGGGAHALHLTHHVGELGHVSPGAHAAYPLIPHGPVTAVKGAFSYDVVNVDEGEEFHGVADVPSANIGQH